MKLKAVLLFFVAVAFALAPAYLPGFGGFGQDQLPIPQNDPPVQPAGYAFGLWGLIYLGLVIHATIGLLRHAEDHQWDAPRLPLIASLAIGITWLWVAQNAPIWAEVEIFAMLILALLAMALAGDKQPWLLQGPISLYGGWLSAASFAGLGVVGAGHGLWFGPVGWAWLCIFLAIFVAVLVILALTPHPAYGLAVIWALVGIAVQNWGQRWGLVALPLLGAALVLMLTWPRLWLLKPNAGARRRN